jgi:hypothetical protein
MLSFLRHVEANFREEGMEVLRREGEEGCVFRDDSLKAQTADASEKSAKSPAQTSVDTRHP